MNLKSINKVYCPVCNTTTNTFGTINCSDADHNFIYSFQNETWYLRMLQSKIQVGKCYQGYYYLFFDLVDVNARFHLCDQFSIEESLKFIDKILKLKCFI